MSDVNQLAIAGFAMLPLVVWLVQTFKEAFGVKSKYLAPVTLGCAFLLVAVVLFAPAPLVTLVGTALAVAVSANMSIRYAKNPAGKAEDKE